MNPQTFILIGRSGCGKGTQAGLLNDYLRKTDPERRVFYLQSGEFFREFIKGEGYSNKLSKDIYDAGGLQPEFLSAWIWSDAFIKNLTGDEHLLLDGTPRRINEAKILDTALTDFYKREKPFVIFLNVSREWAEERLRGRGRKDDTDDTQIAKRMDWYESEVAPTIEHFRNNPHHTFVEIKGEQPIEKVHKDITDKIFGK